MLKSPTNIINYFNNLTLNPDWSFDSERSVDKWTHGYHRYPAKFLPNLVSKLIEQYTKPNDTIADVFAGCGTTLVEAKIHGRKSFGVDINPVAELITNVKVQPIDPIKLTKIFNKVLQKINSYNAENQGLTDTFHPRIDYWFLEPEKKKIAFLKSVIEDLKTNKEIKNFFKCCLSNILKNSSKWLQSSTKPQIDPNKKPKDPFVEFCKHFAKMERKNREFFEKLKLENSLKTTCIIKLADARKTEIKPNSVNAIITSPPYVTSYEYADIHQLTGYWFNYVDNLLEFRKNFIGTFHSNGTKLEVPSIIAQEIIDSINLKDTKSAREVANYFNDMYQVCLEMVRILKKKGTICMVVGNTELRSVKIKTAEVFIEMFSNLGFKKYEVIKRAIPHKLIPTIRDKKTGKFSSVEDENSKKVYPEEYILIIRKK